MSVVRLLVLGVVGLHGQAHGYAVRRELRAWQAEAWTDIKPGSIYHALKQLAREGRLQAVGREESSAGPDRTVYALTPAGAAELRQLVDVALTSPRPEELGAGVAFMQLRPRQHVVNLLRVQLHQATEIRDRLERLEASYPRRDEPPHTRDLLALWSGGFAARARWTAELIERLEAGEYTMADDLAEPPESPA